MTLSSRALARLGDVTPLFQKANSSVFQLKKEGGRGEFGASEHGRMEDEVVRGR